MPITLPSGHCQKPGQLTLNSLLWLALVLLAAFGAMLFNLLLSPFKRAPATK